MPRHGRKDGGDGGFQQPHDVAETDGKGRMGTSDPNLLWAINSGGHVAPVAVQRTSGFSLQLSILSCISYLSKLVFHVTQGMMIEGK